MKGLNQEYQSRIANSLYDLQDIISKAIEEASDIGLENEEFNEYLTAYELLTRNAKIALEEKYLQYSKSEKS